MSSTPLKLWLGVVGAVCVAALVLAGCSEPNEPDSAQSSAPETPNKEQVAAVGTADAVWINEPDTQPPRPLTEDERAELELLSQPNGAFTVYGEMLESEITDDDPEFEGRKEKSWVRTTKPGPHPPISVNLETGEIALMPEELVEFDAEPVESIGRPGARTPGMGTNFQGMGGSSVAPSDSDAAVGPDTIVSAVNVRFRLHTKAGATLATSQLTSFFGISTCCDARAIYDPDSQRYFVSAFVNSCTPRFTLGMSKTSSPGNLLAGTAADRDWLVWTIPLPGSNLFPDFPDIGVDEDAIYLTANMFNCSSGFFTGTDLVVVPKAQLLAGSTSPTSTAFANLTETWSGQNFDVFTLVPTVTYGSPGVGILSDNTARGTVTDGTTNLSVRFLTLWIVENPAGTPSLSDYPVFVQDSFGSIPNAKQNGTTVRIETNSNTLHGLTYRDGSLWVSNTARKSTPTVVTQIAWSEIDVFKALDPATAFLGLEQGGFVQDDVRYYYYPNITADAAGNAAVVMCGSHDSEYVGVWYATRASDDPEGTFQAPALMKDGVTAYNIGNPSRWGDYSGIGVDPVDDMTFWATGEWARFGSTGWGTWIGSFVMPAQTTGLPFSEDFESGGRSVTPGLWSLITGTVDGVGLNEPSGSNSARLNGDPDGQDQFRTRQIDLSGLSNVQVSYWIQRGGGGEAPESDDLLTVDYVDTDGNWSNLQTFSGTGSSESSYTQHTRILAANAYHEHFRLRFSSATSFTGDDWFVDDVNIRDCTSLDGDSDGVGDLCDPCTDADGDDYGVDVGNGIDCPAGSLPDCDDTDSRVNPGAEESAAAGNCADGLDNDCDGLTDLDDPACATGPTCACGDINESGGLVDLADFVLFAGCVNLTGPTTECNASEFECADMNGDNVVDLADFVLFAGAFGSASTDTPPNCQ